MTRTNGKWEIAGHGLANEGRDGRRRISWQVGRDVASFMFRWAGMEKRHALSTMRHWCKTCEVSVCTVKGESSLPRRDESEKTDGQPITR